MKKGSQCHEWMIRNVIHFYMCILTTRFLWYVERVKGPAELWKANCWESTFQSADICSFQPLRTIHSHRHPTAASPFSSHASAVYEHTSAKHPPSLIETDGMLQVQHLAEVPGSVVVPKKTQLAVFTGEMPVRDFVLVNAMLNCTSWFGGLTMGDRIWG